MILCLLIGVALIVKEQMVVPLNQTATAYRFRSNTDSV